MPIEYLEQVQRKATKLAKISKKAYESKRGRPRMTWKDNIKKWTGLDNDDLLPVSYTHLTLPTNREV